MIPLLYTDSDKVMATIGLTPDDLPDSFFEAKDFIRTLSVDLYIWLPTHSSVFIPPGSVPSTDKLGFESDCLVLYCSYFLASRTAESVLAIMVKESDGQSEYDRFSGLDLQKLTGDMANRAAYYRQTLLSSLQSDNVVTSTSKARAVSPSYDPVTG